MKGLILAAGRGSRMNELTLHKPKCLLELGGISLFQRQLEALHLGGVSDIGIVTGYRRELLSRPGLTEFHNPGWAGTQMVASLMHASAWLDLEACVVSYSDIFYQHQPIQDLINSAAPIAVAYDPEWRALWESRFSDPLADAETFRLNEDGTLADIGGRAESIDEIEGQFMGLLHFTPVGWGEITRIFVEGGENADQLDMTTVLRLVIRAARVPVLAIPYEGALWGEIDSPTDLAMYESKFEPTNR